MEEMGITKAESQMTMYKFLKRTYYQYFRKYRMVRSAVMAAKSLKWRLSQGSIRKPSWEKVKGSKDNLRIAVVCDNLTWANFKAETDAVYITPATWRTTMEQFRPNVFFCEAAWKGLHNEWEGRVFHDRTLSVDNRFILKDILCYCKKAHIPTVFWNKEDTPAFDDDPYSFIDTAMLFDHIFTTAVECISCYQKKGHSSVHLMMFGYSEKLFHFQALPQDDNTAVFLGSWYAMHPERCEEMSQMFDWLLSMGMNLEIYDRMSEERLPDRQYPEKYQPYLHEGVPYEETGQIMSKATYVININTVKNSKTMFARRVFEAMACGRIVISNESLGMRELFPGRVWFIREKFPVDQREQIIKENLLQVRKEFTFKKQLFAAMKSAKVLQ